MFALTKRNCSLEYEYMQRAFSLVELSIVLVILGLLTGGILAGQSLIRAAELRKLSVTPAQFTAEWMSFKGKYQGIPGDLVNATKFFGGFANPSVYTGTDPTNANGTVNGDGNGWVEWNIVPADGGASHGGEQYWVNNHLYLSGLSVDRAAPHNSPTLPRSSHFLMKAPAISGFMMIGRNSSTKWAGIYIGTPANPNWGPLEKDGHALQFVSLLQNNQAWGPAIKPEEIWNIDQKLDDGKPLTGVIQAYDGGDPSSGSNPPPRLACLKLTGSDWEYDLSVTDITCRFAYFIK